jgi:hypothetical protein
MRTRFIVDAIRSYTTSRIVVGGVMAWAVVSCTPAINLGDTADGGAGSSTCGPGGNPSASEAGAWDSGDLASAVGTWTGYIEAQSFPSGSDRIVIVFESASDGSVTGTVTYGQGTPPPPPTGQNVGYLVGDGQVPRLIEGFAYTALQPSFDGNRLQVHTVTGEPWNSWCELQTPTHTDFPCPLFGCLPSSGYTCDGNVCTITDPASGATETIDPGWIRLCMFPSVCTCSATSCAVAMDEPDSWLDIHMNESGSFDGVINGLETLANVPVHFSRSQ